MELVPEDISNHPSVLNDSKRRGKDPSRILLDRSLHHAAMLKIKDSHKRGRPDLVHNTVLNIVSTPLYIRGLVKLYVHTYGNLILDIKEGTRLPKNYLRFRGLIEKHLSERLNTNLVSIYEVGIDALIKEIIKPDIVIGLSTLGKFKQLYELAKTVAAAKVPCLLIGGFPHGHFSNSTIEVIDELIKIHEMSLDAGVVAARTIYEIEKEVIGKETESRI